MCWSTCELAAEAAGSPTMGGAGYVCVRWSCPADRRVLRNHSCSQCMHLQTRLFYHMLDSISCKKVIVVGADYHFNIACEPKAQLYIGSEAPPIPSPLMSRETCDTNYIILHAYSTDEILMCTSLQLVEGQSQG